VEVAMTSPLKLLIAAARGVVALIVAALLWELIARRIGSERLVPDVLSVIRAIVRAFLSETFWEHVAATLRRLGAGYTAAAVVGIPVGLALGRVGALRLALGALVSGLASSPLVILAPLTTLWLGVGDGSKVLLAFISAVFPLMGSIMDGLAQAQPHTSGEMPRASAPERSSEMARCIVAGLRAALIPAIGAVVIAEMIGSVSGLGLLMMSATAALDVPTIVAVFLVVALPGIVAASILRSIEAGLAHGSA
jgi:ABC-type nitrate/sulfonate/bicarbonate transport system permease component